MDKRIPTTSRESGSTHLRDAMTGKRKWKVKLGDRIRSAPSISTALDSGEPTSPVMLTPSKRDLVLLASGVWPVLFHNRAYSETRSRGRGLAVQRSDA